MCCTAFAFNRRQPMSDQQKIQNKTLCKSCRKGISAADGEDQFGLCRPCLEEPTTLLPVSDATARKAVEALAAYIADELVDEDWDQPMVHSLCQAMSCTWQELKAITAMMTVK